MFFVAILLLVSGLVPSVESISYKRLRIEQEALGGVSSYSLYTSRWINTHETWFNVTHEALIGCNHGTVHFPVCIDGKPIGTSMEDECPAYSCAEGRCVPTPEDTIDMLPPNAATSLDENVLCAMPSGVTAAVKPYFGLDTGVPPLFVDLNYLPLVLRGTIRGSLGTTCAPIRDARIEAWHVDPAQFDVRSVLERQGASDTQFNASQSLRGKSCRGLITTSSEGTYEFFTTLPPSYGPPRHINIMVSAPGFQTLITRAYFADDWRLNQLTILRGEENRRFVDGISGEYATITFRSNPRDMDLPGMNMTDPEREGVFPGNIGRDPRVLFVKVEDQGLSSVRLVADFDIVLKPNRKTDAWTADIDDTSAEAQSVRNVAGMPTTPSPPLDLDGMWYDDAGGLITVETRGSVFIASEYPHPRQWGTVIGTLHGNTIRGVDFRGFGADDGILQKAQRYMQLVAIGESRPLLSPLNEQLMWQDGDSSSFFANSKQVSELTSEANAILEEIVSTLKHTRGGGVGDDVLLNSLWTSAYSTGVVVDDDPVGTDPREARIEWSGGWGGPLVRKYWSRYNVAGGYRYLRLLIQRETGGYSGGRLEINEIEFFEGILKQYEYPRKDMKMVSPRTPKPQMVTCSTFRSQEEHCFRAFDGDRSSNSAWMSDPVGSRRNALHEPQWVIIDMGEGYGVRPTSMRITCGASDPTNARGCPMTFELQGSNDDVRYERLLRIDMYDYSGGYNAARENESSSMTFDFVWESPGGRQNGQRCGSCDSGPNFMCSVNAIDHTCSSSYCGVSGYCESLPVCPAGWFLSTGVDAALNAHQKNVHKRQDIALRLDTVSIACAPCPAGRFGNTSGLVRGNCSGVCEAGYYCTGASVSVTQHACGAPAYFCPRGSVQPIPIGAGEKGTGGDEEHRTGVDICSLGHYCRGGIERKCPQGRYGDVTGLSHPECSAKCLSGTYCPEGSVVPTICPLGYFCPDGREKVKCPAGTYGAVTGLNDRACSGQCDPGYYCPPASISPRQVMCPAGRFGDTYGLKGSDCTSLCHEGYFCPNGSASPTQYRCGGPGVFCPIGSSLPTAVTPGFYSIGGLDEMTRTDQLICELGNYCSRSRYPETTRVLKSPGPYDDGVVIGGGEKFDCPSGTYGGTLGIVSDYSPSEDLNHTGLKATFLCSGLCDPGHYCPVNSFLAKQIKCPAGRYGAYPGIANSLCSEECPTGHYCPPGSVLPTQCPGGTFGNVTGLVDSSCSLDCVDKAAVLKTISNRLGYTVTSVPPGYQCDPQPNYCQEGYYCPEGSVSATQVQCGDPSVFCPRGSARPTPVQRGYYSLPYNGGRGSNTQYGEEICPLGYFCRDGLRILCPEGTYGASLGLSTPQCSGLCEEGHYCPAGSINGTYHRCPAGRYGATKGLANSACTGVCSAGYYCPEVSTSPTQRQCGMGDGHADGSGQNAYFCPQESPEPLRVLVGYYSVGFNRTTRSDQRPCVLGSYCIDGVMQDCPAGRYGAEARMATSDCSGPCHRGYYCPRGSTKSTEYPCPIGRYGAEEGLTSPACSGPCRFPELCPEGTEIDHPSSTLIQTDLV